MLIFLIKNTTFYYSQAQFKIVMTVANGKDCGNCTCEQKNMRVNK